MVHASSVLFGLTMLTIHLLSVHHWLSPARATDWFNKGHAMCYHVYVIMHVKDTDLSVVRDGHCVPLAGFCLSLYSLHMLNKQNKQYNGRGCAFYG